MSKESAPKRCPKCGGMISTEAAQGLCPKCLLLEASAPTEAGKGPAAKPTPPRVEDLTMAFPQLEVGELIGQGGMGFVFKARQRKLDRWVALKILPQSLAGDPAFAERFTREGRVLARLSHPNIVTVHDFGEANGLFYLLMEFVDGVNLRQAMKAGRFTPAQALAIVPAICEALQYAHNEGILHRDIKPENILLDAKGRVKIADFGIAKLVGERQREPVLTGTDVPIGTPHYMAPEQLEQPSEVDHRADIYSLGVVFYEMLTGELPLGRFAPPSQRSAVDPRLDAVVLRALEKQPERRTQNAGEMKTEVETITQGEPAANTEVFHGGRQSHHAPLSRVTKAALAALAGLAVWAGIIWLAPHLKSGSGNLPASAGRSNLVLPAEVTNALAGKTIVLTGATNGLSTNTRTVSIKTDSTLFPDESLLSLVKKTDGMMEESLTSFSLHNRPRAATTTSWFSWFIPDSFDDQDVTSAIHHLRQNLEDRPIHLKAGETLELFSLTNRSAGVMKGFIQFKRLAPEPAANTQGVKATATVHMQTYGGSLLIFYSAEVPPGYSLQATGRGSDSSYQEAITSFAHSTRGRHYHSSWYLGSTFQWEHLQDGNKQLQELGKQGALQVRLGELHLLFSITNNAGGYYQGFFELVGPSTPAPQ